MVAFGMRKYGVVDQVPGVLHVASNFLHFNFIPLLPVGSVVVVAAKVFGAEQEAKAPFSLKSVFFGWLRAALLVGAVVFFFSGFDNDNARRRRRARPPQNQPANNEPTGAVLWTLAGVAALAWWGSHWLTRANAGRARELARLAGVPEELALARFASVPPDDFRGGDDSLRPLQPRGERFDEVPPDEPNGWTNPVRRDRGQDDVYRLE